VEIQEPSFFGQEISKILVRVHLGDMAERLAFGVARRRSFAVDPLLLDVQESALGDPECLVDGLVQVGTLVLAQQVVGLVTDDEIAVAGNPHFNMHNRRNGPGEILVALIDPHPARGQPVIASLQLGDPGANFLLYGWRAFEVVKRDFKRNLQHCISIGLALFMRLLTLDHAESLP
jgi:hypothetical protein